VRDDNPPSTEVGGCFGTFSPSLVDMSLGGSLFIFHKGVHMMPALLKKTHTFGDRGGHREGFLREVKSMGPFEYIFGT
jgi:hypothetical protein